MTVPKLCTAVLRTQTFQFRLIKTKKFIDAFELKIFMRLLSEKKKQQYSQQF